MEELENCIVYDERCRESWWWARNKKPWKYVAAAYSQPFGDTSGGTAALAVNTDVTVIHSFDDNNSNVYGHEYGTNAIGAPDESAVMAVFMTPTWMK